MAYQAVDEIMTRCEKDGVEFWKAVQFEDCEENGISEEESWKQMTLMWTRMKESVEAYDPEAVSRSGLVGSEGKQMDVYRENEKPLCGDFVSKVIANALKMGCNNACMKRIVAAPTAGACGVMPAVLVTYYKEYGVSDSIHVCGSGNWTGHCKSCITCRSIWWMSGGDRFSFRNGSRSNLWCARRK